MDATGIASSFGKAARGCASVMTTVVSFGADEPDDRFGLCPPRTPRALDRDERLAAAAFRRSGRARAGTCETTCCAVNGVPSWNFTPRRRWNV